MLRHGQAVATSAESVQTALPRLPKVELHVHLEGSMSVDTVATLADRHDVDNSSISPDGLPEQFSFDGFPDFARQFFFGLSLLRSGDDLVTVTHDLAKTPSAQNVRYDLLQVDASLAPPSTKSTFKSELADFASSR